MARGRSGAGNNRFGSLLETTRGGQEPIRLESGEERRFLEDGDEVILRVPQGHPQGLAKIGFGESRGESTSTCGDPSNVHQS
ncbi:hypothetical protein [Bradyrhizobium sp. JR3.5]